MDEHVVSAETFASSLGSKALHCRELGHTWRPWTVEFDRKSRSYFRELRCASCRTLRKQVLDSHGHVIANSYTYPDGYLADHVERGTLSRDVFRLESIVRFIEQAERKVS